MELTTDCVRCGNPLDLGDPQPCENGGLCEALVGEPVPGYVVTDLGTDRQQVYPATMQRRSFLAVDPATAQDPDVMGFVIVDVVSDFADGHQVIPGEVVARPWDEPTVVPVDEISTGEWACYLDTGSFDD